MSKECARNDPELGDKLTFVEWKQRPGTNERYWRRDTYRRIWHDEGDAGTFWNWVYVDGSR